MRGKCDFTSLKVKSFVSTGSEFATIVVVLVTQEGNTAKEKELGVKAISVTRSIKWH